MNKRILILHLLISISLGSLSAQTFVGKLNPFPSVKSTLNENQDTLKILAVMAEFKADEDDATFGDGTFGSIYSQDYGTDIIDPLPHDKEYFEDHLLFAKNYFRKVSGGKLVIDYTVLNYIVKLPDIMRDYAPTPADQDNFMPLAEFCEEVWTDADNNISVDFSDYDLFTIFHAGVGRDIQVPGSIGNDRDLPSVYLSHDALKNVYGDTFNGFEVNNGQFRITNTMILPETESRELTSFDETALIELSINGLIVASIASHLGLPDLFDTNTGLSSIGRFGLMDGQSIFTFSGLFPPEPSPWEKLYLGWIDPVVVDRVNSRIELTAAAIAQADDTAYIKIPINSTEYYLVENRSRDAFGDGCTVTYKIGDQVLTKTFDKDYDSFISYNVDTLSGVVIDIDEYDWAVPPFDRDNDDIESFSDVGIIIWHIDETVINSKIESNSINTDKFRKGVAVVEADGINDIGEEFQTVFGDVVIGEGSREDTWYASNPSEYYKNVFNDNSTPSAKSNTGANSLISMSGFSDVDLRMSFDIKFGGDFVNLLASANLPQFEGEVKWVNSVLSNVSRTFFYSSTDGFITSDSELSTFNIFREDIDYAPASFSFNSYAGLLFSHDREIRLYSFRQNSRDISVYTDSVSISTPIAVKSIEDKVNFVAGNSSGFVNVYEILADAGNTVNGIAAYSAFTDSVKQVAVDDNFIAAISNSAYWDINSGTLELPGKPVRLLITFQDNNYKSVVLLDDNRLIVIANGVISNTISISNDVSVKGISLADLKADGTNYLVVNTGEQLDAFNPEGARAENFPIDAPEGTEFVKTPIALDITFNTTSDIMALTSDGRIYAYSGITGKIIDPFPVSSGSDALTDPIIYQANDDLTSLVMLGEFNDVQNWQVSSEPSEIRWGGLYGDSYNSSFTVQPRTSNVIEEFFPKSKAYNWPNPVYEGETYFRFFVSENAQVEINIFDLAGDLVAKLNQNVTGGVDNEIPWNISDIQSGVYFAHLNIDGTSGKSDYKIIKVAVIK